MLVFPKTLWYTAYCLLLQAVSGNVSTQKKEGFFRKEWDIAFPLLSCGAFRRDAAAPEAYPFGPRFAVGKSGMGEGHGR